MFISEKSSRGCEKFAVNLQLQCIIKNSDTLILPVKILKIWNKFR